MVLREETSAFHICPATGAIRTLKLLKLLTPKVAFQKRKAFMQILSPTLDTLLNATLKVCTEYLFWRPIIFNYTVLLLFNRAAD